MLCRRGAEYRTSRPPSGIGIAPPDDTGLLAALIDEADQVSSGHEARLTRSGSGPSLSSMSAVQDTGRNVIYAVRESTRKQIETYADTLPSDSWFWGTAEAALLFQG
jgi:hypothetical protein